MQTPTTRTDEKPTICVILDDSKPSEIKDFHCPVCGHLVFKYFTALKLIHPGKPEQGDGRFKTVVQCRGRITEYINDGQKITSVCKAQIYIA